MLLEVVTDGKITELRRVAVPSDRMAAGPIAGRHGADVERHANAVAGVESGAANLGKLPGGPQITRPHFGIGLKPAGREDHAFRLDLDCAAVVLHTYALNTVIVGDQRQGSGVVSDFNAVFPGDLGMRVNKARAAAPGFDS